MIGILPFHKKSKSISQNENVKKIPFLSKRVHPLDFFPQTTIQNTNNDHSPKSNYNGRKSSNRDTIITHSPFNLFENKLPPLRYSSFQKTNKESKKTEQNIRRMRRGSDLTIPITVLLSKKYNIEVPSVLLHSLDNERSIVESIINIRAFRRIESHEIEYPSKTLGEKLVRVQQLVIDPLLAEGGFNN